MFDISRDLEYCLMDIPVAPKGHVYTSKQICNTLQVHPKAYDVLQELARETIDRKIAGQDDTDEGFEVNGYGEVVRTEVSSDSDYAINLICQLVDHAEDLDFQIRKIRTKGLIDSINRIINRFNFRVAGGNAAEMDPALASVYEVIGTIPGSEDVNVQDIELGSMVYANKPGDGSAREQAASCQRVIGGLANITKEYATKRYRSNVMNWGMIPFHIKGEPEAFEVDDYIYIPGIRKALDGDLSDIKAYVIKDGKAVQIDLYILDMTENEREIVKAGSLINFNRNRKK
jgi:hypothetical protein